MVRDERPRTRVLNAIPAAAFETNALLALLRIEETDAVPTASVSCERRPVLRINPAFVERHCRSDEHLFLLAMHEPHHVLLGHPCSCRPSVQCKMSMLPPNGMTVSATLRQR